METNATIQTNLDIGAKLKEVENERDALSDKIAIDQERLKALNRLGRQYVNLIKQAEALNKESPQEWLLKKAAEALEEQK